MKFFINRFKTLLSLFNFFLVPKRVILLPIIIILLLVAVLLVFSKGFAVVAPFVYTLF